MWSLFKIISFTRSLWPYYLAVTIFSALLALVNQLTPFIIKAAADVVVAAIGSHNQPNIALGIWLAIAFLASDVAGSLAFHNPGRFFCLSSRANHNPLFPTLLSKHS